MRDALPPYRVEHRYEHGETPWLLVAGADSHDEALTLADDWCVKWPKEEARVVVNHVIYRIRGKG